MANKSKLTPNQTYSPKIVSTEVRDWCRIMPGGATLSNCYKARKGDRDGPESEHWAVPQSFTFMVREGKNSKGIILF